jgi:beta-lactamase regulating signal transducer with metallopeptidase domain
MSGSNFVSFLIDCGFRASFPVGIAWAVTRLLPRSSAATRHFTWACGIAIAALLPITTIATPRWSVTPPAPLARLASNTRIEAVPSTNSDVAMTKQIGVDSTPRPTIRRRGSITLSTIAAWVWIMGVVVAFGQMLIGHFAAWRLYRTTRRMQNSWIQDAERLTTRELRLNGALCLVESARVSVPVVLHLWRPTIVMPEAAAQWPWCRVRAVLLHELAHIKRNDMLVQSLTQLACVAYWFNPLVWFAARQLRLERERACDDFVLMEGTSGTDYATHLFEIARVGSTPAFAPFAIGLAAHRSQLEQRLVAILNPRTPRHSTTVLGRFIVALPVLFVALAAGAVQITARAMQVPLRAIKIPAAAIQVHTGAAQFSVPGTQVKMRTVPTGSSAEWNSQSEEFHWTATMHEDQTVEVHIARGSIQILPSGDDTVRIRAHTDDPSKSIIQMVSTPSGVKFCNIVATVRGSQNYCEPGQDTSRVQEDQPATDFVIYAPAGLHFAGSTVLGDITAEHPSADIDMATVDGDITFQLAADTGATFKGNVIAGVIDSDFPLIDNTPTLPSGERPASNAPRIVHAMVGSGDLRLSATVVNGNIRLLRR